MFEKLKQKMLNFYKTKIFVIFGLFVVLGGFLVIPLNFSRAATKGCEISGDTRFCPNLQVSIAPTSASVGESIKITVQSSGFVGKPRTYSFYICSSTNQVDCASETGLILIKPVDASAAETFTIDYTVLGALGKPGRYKIQVQLTEGRFIDSASGSSSGEIDYGYADFEVLAGSTTGGPKIVVLETSSGDALTTSNQEVKKLFSFSYMQGGGPSVASYKVYCNTKDQNTSQPLSISDTSFKCIYPSQATTTPATTYNGIIQAFDSKGSKVAESGFSSIVTGNEKKLGASPTLTPSNPVDGLLTLINGIIGIILGLLSELVYGIFYWLVAPLIQSMLSIHTYTDTFAAVIYPGWVVIRNICNIFFIVALIVIALATLFRVESYQYRGLLVQLILAALLVNFSLVISQAILGLADTLQAQFLPANVTVIRSLAGDLMVGYRSTIFNANSIFTGSFAGTIQHLFWLALSMGSFAVFCAIAIFLVIRIVALWLLLLVSPVAYAAGVLPATASVRKQWWDNFLKYAFFTPIMAFFLNLTAVIANTYKKNPVLQEVTNSATAAEMGDGNLAGFVFKVASNILLLVFLIAALKVADMAGIYGASGITSIAQKGIFAPFAGAGMLAGRVFEGVQNKTGVTMDPREWAAAWKKYSADQKAKRKDIRAGKKVLGLNLGSPQDMLKNYANVAAVKKKFNNISTKGRYNQLKNEYENLEKKDKLMSDDERAAQIAKRDELQESFNKLGADITARQTTIEKDKQDSEGISGQLEKLASDRSDLGNLKANLIANGKDSSEVDANIAANEKAKNDLIKQKAKKDEGIAKLSAEQEQKKQDFSRLDSQIGNIDGRISEDNEERKKLGVTSFSGKEKDEVKKKLTEFRNLAAQRKAPEAYYAREARLHLEAEEAKKISDIEDEGELNALLVDAINQKDQHKATAILKKLTKDVNLNETLEDFGKETSFEGFKQFLTEDFKNKIGIDNHELMQIATEIGYIAENTKQYNFARATKINPKSNHIEFVKSGKEHDDIVITQMRKSDPRASSGLVGRFSVVDEWEEGGERKRSLNNVGVAHILRYANPATIKHMGQFNTYTLEAAVSDRDWREKLLNPENLKKYGAKQEDAKLLIKEIEKIMANKAM